MVECPPLLAVVGSVPDWVIPKAIKMVPIASLLGTQDLGLDFSVLVCILWDVTITETLTFIFMFH